MAIDWSTLVLAPNQDIFGVIITVIPYVSGGIQYTARAIWSQKPVLIDTGNNTFHSSTQAQIDIRLSEFDNPIVQGDYIIIDDPTVPNVSSITWTVFDTQPDGQGALGLILKDNKGQLP